MLSADLETLLIVSGYNTGGGRELELSETDGGAEILSVISQIAKNEHANLILFESPTTAYIHNKAKIPGNPILVRKGKDGGVLEFYSPRTGEPEKEGFAFSPIYPDTYANVVPNERGFHVNLFRRGKLSHFANYIAEHLHKKGLISKKKLDKLPSTGVKYEEISIDSNSPKVFLYDYLEDLEKRMTLLWNNVAKRVGKMELKKLEGYDEGAALYSSELRQMLNRPHYLAALPETNTSVRFSIDEKFSPDSPVTHNVMVAFPEERSRGYLNNLMSDLDLVPVGIALNGESDYSETRKYSDPANPGKFIRRMQHPAQFLLVDVSINNGEHLINFLERLKNPSYGQK